jgi:hypothetical protein
MTIIERDNIERLQPDYPHCFAYKYNTDYMATCEQCGLREQCKENMREKNDR